MKLTTEQAKEIKDQQKQEIKKKSYRSRIRKILYEAIPFRSWIYKSSRLYGR